MSTRDTIFALATPLARSGVAIIRISGPDALAALIALSGKGEWTPNMARTTALRAPGNDVIIDRGLAIYFQNPKSFTGEDVVELHIHGSLAVIRELTDTLATMSGCRPAEAGEFSRRAYANGKFDLIEAEGLADLIDAETPRQKAQALRQMGGELSRYYDEVRERIIRALAHLEAYIDFPEEDIPEAVLQALTGDINELIKTIELALADHRRGEQLREGIRVVIVGAPNVGKSSLLNAIARKDAAIVSHQAGTTRDSIEIHMEMSGFPVILTDTAGLRDSSDDIEQEGIRRALLRAGEADIKIVMFDGGQLPELDEKTKTLIDSNSLIVINKSDLLGQGADTVLPFTDKPVFISVKTADGMDGLLAALSHKIVTGYTGANAPVITRARHRAALTEALESLSRFSLAAPLEISCEELRRAALSVGKITGKIHVDDILDVVFRQFCIGK